MADAESVVWRVQERQSRRKCAKCPAQAHACMPQGGAGLQEPGEDEAECVSHVCVCVCRGARGRGACEL